MNRILAVSAVLVLAVVVIGASYVMVDRDDGGRILYSDGMYDGDRVEAGDGIVADCQFDRDGFAFVGWNTRIDGTGTNYVPGDPLDTGKGTMILYAQWDPVMGTVMWTPGAKELLGDVMMITDDGELVADSGTVVPEGHATFSLNRGALQWERAEDGAFIAAGPENSFSVKLNFTGAVIYEDCSIGEDGDPVWTVNVGGQFSITVLCEDL